MKTMEILKELRTENNLSMEELCEKLNKNYNLKITKSMVSRWENGQASPNNTYLSAYAKFFNIDLNYLAGLTDERKPLNILTSANALSAKDKKIRLAARNMKELSDEDLEMIISMMERLGKK